MKEAKLIQKEKQEVADKIAARAFAKSYLQALIPSVFEHLSTNGYFYDKIERELENQLFPWLTAEVDKNRTKRELALKLTDGKKNLLDLIRSAIHKYRTMGPKE
jgi:radial spoke head protein 3